MSRYRDAAEQITRDLLRACPDIDVERTFDVVIVFLDDDGAQVEIYPDSDPASDGMVVKVVTRANGLDAGTIDSEHDTTDAAVARALELVDPR